LGLLGLEVDNHRRRFPEFQKLADGATGLTVIAGITVTGNLAKPIILCPAFDTGILPAIWSARAQMEGIKRLVALAVATSFGEDIHL
jgi:hypothetical protein